MAFVMKFDPLDFSKLRTYPLRQRANKVAVENFAAAHQRGDSFASFYKNMPAFLAAADFKKIVAAICESVRAKRPVLLMMGAHPIKCGLNPIIIDAIRSGIVSAVAFNGAGAIHDFELAYQGETSEDVQAGLDDGSFGMVEETSRLMNEALERGVAEGLGAGASLARAVENFPDRSLSIMNACREAGVPISVHIAIGTDIIHQHPAAKGAVLGEATYRDFQLLASVIAKLEGGVALNIGSAVIMPEVFLKALTIARNLGHEVKQFTTATLDMIRHYRPTENVVRRPTHLGGQGFYVVGHHEIMLPLLFAAVKENL
ncbi:MAG: hypothetical protein M3O82_02440 [Verrucomicrobiota bacterium]|nr:hypothetical protein [Verrucomicrobiota bacterium]